MLVIQLLFFLFIFFVSYFSTYIFRCILPDIVDESSVNNELNVQVERLSQVSLERQEGDTEGATEGETRLQIECAKRPLLDGTYFEHREEGSNVEKFILVECKTCKKTFKTTLRATSNLTTHLKVRFGANPFFSKFIIFLTDNKKNTRF